MAATTTPIHEKIRSSLPPLDPNGQPFSMMLRGTLAELGELRSLLMDKSTREQLMQPADDVFELAFAVRAKIDADPFDDAIPPAPIVIVYDVAGVTDNPDPVLNPPAPPPPPLD